MNIVRPLVALSLLALLAGCGSDSQTAPVNNGPVGIATNHTDPAALLDAWTEALEAKDLEACAALLEVEPGSTPEPGGRTESGFRYHPQPEAIEEYPWMQEQPWDRGVELGIMEHMFDPEFESQVAGAPVEEIRADCTVLTTDNSGDGETQVTSNLLVTVLWGTNTGVTADVRLIHVLAPDADGFLRIREQREEALLGPRVEALGWGAIKAYFH